MKAAVLEMKKQQCSKLKQQCLQVESGDFHVFAANRKRNQQTYVRLLQKEKRKLEVCLPWSANDKWQ
jgi:hypothetical protein